MARSEKTGCSPGSSQTVPFLIKLETNFSGLSSLLFFCFLLDEMPHAVKAASGLGVFNFYVCVCIASGCHLVYKLGRVQSWSESDAGSPRKACAAGMYFTLSAHQNCHWHFTTVWASRAILASCHPRMTPSLTIKDFSGKMSTLFTCLCLRWHVPMMLSESPATTRFIHCLLRFSQVTDKRINNQESVWYIHSR